ncbi:MAG: hypothetical protein Ct9H300mP25_08960 [Acidobacteriota bacterium]|nr:MAG: hypothetical protein Ct9H300mP25_08960 [Acidobacteriota bacterium]
MGRLIPAGTGMIIMGMSKFEADEPPPAHCPHRKNWNLNVRWNILLTGCRASAFLSAIGANIPASLDLHFARKQRVVVVKRVKKIVRIGE